MTPTILKGARRLSSFCRQSGKRTTTVVATKACTFETATPKVDFRIAGTVSDRTRL